MSRKLHWEMTSQHARKTFMTAMMTNSESITTLTYSVHNCSRTRPVAETVLVDNWLSGAGNNICFFSLSGLALYVQSIVCKVLFGKITMDYTNRPMFPVAQYTTTAARTRHPWKLYSNYCRTDLRVNTTFVIVFCSLELLRNY